ncbi:MAG: hypothetical protein ACT4OZ_03555 [Gemmatimonadota bacterium]
MRIRQLIGATGVLAFAATAGHAAGVFEKMWMGGVAGKDGSTITGSATMKAATDGNGSVVEVSIKGDVAGSVRPWHVHIGSCAAAGGVFGGGRSYTPITADAQGAGTSRATLTATLPDSGRYYVNIHESAANMSRIVACGDLMFHDM